MDPKVYIFFFMVFLSIVLADYMSAYKFGDSHMVQDNSDVRLPAYKIGKASQTVHYNHDLISFKKKKSITKRSSHKSSKKSRKSRHRRRKLRTTTEPDKEENTLSIYKNDVIVRKNHNNVKTKRRKSESSKRRREPNNNKQTDNSNIEMNNIALEHNAQDISIAPFKPDRRIKRKFGKKYRPEFEYIKLGKDTKKYNSLNPKIDIPDNAEGVLEDSDEAYMKVLPPKIQKPNRKKATEYIVQYDNFEEPKSVEEKPKDQKLIESLQISQERQEQHKLKSKNIEIIDDPAGTRRKYSPIFQYSNFYDKRHFSNDYSDVVDSGIEVIEITTTTTTTKAPETTTYGQTEIIYLTPDPENKRYKPIFKYQAVNNEPYNYDIPHHRNTKYRKIPKYASDESNSESKESGETNNNEKIVVNLGNKDSDEDLEKHSSEEDESDTEEKSTERRDFDRDNDNLKISRKIRAREGPTFDVKQYYNAVIKENIKELENIKETENIKEQDNVKEQYNVTEQENIKPRESSELRDNMDEKRRQIKRPHTRNFVKLEKVEQEPNEISKVPIRDTNGHTKIFLTDMGTYNKPNFSPHSGPTSNFIENMEKAMLFDNVKDKRASRLPYYTQANKKRVKISKVSAEPAMLFENVKDSQAPGLPYYTQPNKKRFKTSKASAKPIKPIDRMKDRYTPGLPYHKKMSKKVRAKITGKDTTKDYDVSAQPIIPFDRVKPRFPYYKKQSDNVRGKISGKDTIKDYEVTAQSVIFVDKVKDRYQPLLPFNAQSKVSEEYTTKKISEEYTTQNYEVTTKPVTYKYKEDNMVYHPDIEFNDHFNQIREKFVGKSSTIPEEMKLFRPSKLKQNYGTNLEDFVRKRTPSLDERYGDLYEGKNYKKFLADFGRTTIPTPDEKFGDDVEKNYNFFFEDIERKRKPILEQINGDVDDVKNFKSLLVDVERKRKAIVDEEYLDVDAEKKFKSFLEDVERKRKAIGGQRYGAVFTKKNYTSLVGDVERKREAIEGQRYGAVYTEKNYKSLADDVERKTKPILDQTYGGVDAEKNFKSLLDVERKRKTILDKSYGDVYTEENYKTVPEDLERKRKAIEDERYGDVYTENNYKTVSEKFEGKMTTTLDPRLGDMFTEKQTVNENLGTVNEEEEKPTESEKQLERETTVVGHKTYETKCAMDCTSALQSHAVKQGSHIPHLHRFCLDRPTNEVFATEITTEKYEPPQYNEMNYTIREYSEPKKTVYRKRSTRYYDTVRSVKIRKAKILEKFTTTSSEDLTTISDYGEPNEQKETENTPSYQVQENIVDVPDTRTLAGPVAIDYVIVPEGHARVVDRKSAIPVIPSLNLNGTDDPEHPIVNIVQGMKDYLTVIGKGLYTAVKDIFKEKLS